MGLTRRIPALCLGAWIGACVLAGCRPGLSPGALFTSDSPDGEVQRVAAALLAKRRGASAPTPQANDPRYTSREQRPGATRAMPPVSPIPPSFAAQLPAPSPEKAGLGIIVCTPVNQPRTEALNHFGIGCGRWLQFEVGGQPEFGRTPFGADLYQHWTELEQQGTGPTPEVAFRRAPGWGATHVAAGEISGTRENARLTYRLVQLSDRKQIGDPVVLAGSTDAIRAKLPEAARDLCRRLGVAQPKVADEVLETANELALLGAAQPQGHKRVPDDLFYQLEDLGHKSGAGAAQHLLAHLVAGGDDAHIAGAAHSMLQRHPENTQAWGIASLAGLSLRRAADPAHQQTLRAFATRYPSNWVLNQALIYHARTENRALALNASRGRSPHLVGGQDRRAAVLEEARLLAERGVLCSPRNSVAWYDLAKSYSDVAGNIRQARTADAISAAEWKQLRDLYEKWLQHARKAAELAPDDTDTWYELANAGTFAGSEKEAEQALWKALAAPQGEYGIYHWGLEMFAPKWGDQPKKRIKVLRLAASDPHLRPSGRLALARAVLGSVPDAAVQPLLKTDEERQQFAQALAVYRRATRPTPAVPPTPAVAAATKSSPRAGAGNPTPAPARVQRLRPLAEETKPVPAGAQRLAVQKGGVFSLAWNQSHTRLASGGYDGTVQVWTSLEGAALTLKHGNEPIHVVAWSPDGTRLASGGHEGRIRVWDIPSGEPRGDIAAHQGILWALAWRPDGKQLVSGGSDAAIRFWDPATGARARDGRKVGGPVRTLAFSPDGTQLVCFISGVHPTLNLLDPNTGEERRQLDTTPRLISRVAWSSSGRRLAVTTGREVAVWDVTGNTEAKRAAPSTNSYYVLDLAWAKTDKELVLLRGDHKTYSVDPDSAPQRLVATPLHRDEARRAVRLAWNDRTGRYVTGAMDGTVMAWTVQRGSK